MGISGGLHGQHLMRAPVALATDPVCDHAAGVLQGFEPVSVHALVRIQREPARLRPPAAIDAQLPLTRLRRIEAELSPSPLQIQMSAATRNGRAIRCMFNGPISSVPCRSNRTRW